MDAVELGCRRAADLHIAAVARGLDPTNPYAFAVGEAEHRGLSVETANSGSAQLDGGRATLVAVDDLILHENIPATRRASRSWRSRTRPPISTSAMG